MRQNYLLNVLGFHLIELVAAVAIVFLISACWRRNPDAVIVRLLRNRYQLWFALILFTVPAVVNRQIFWYLIAKARTSPVGVSGLNIYTNVLLHLFYGAIAGIVACLISAAIKREQPVHKWAAVGISAVLILLMTWLPTGGGPFRLFSMGNIPEILLALVLIIFVTARAFPKRDSPDNPQKPKSFAPALFLAFLPSAMILLMLPFVNKRMVSPAPLIFCCLVSIVCCFTSSFMLFRRGTAWTIFGGIVFLLLNAFISFCFGCGAVLTQMKF